MKALIKVGYGCNEHCTFCHTQDVRHIEGASPEIEAKIRRAAELGHSMVVLSGGEATIRPELTRWATMIADLGLDLGLVTNGLVLAYDDVLESLLERRLRYVYMSLHSGDARVHNSLVRRDSFDVAMRAIENLSGRGLDLTINCVVTRRNVDHLDSLVDQLLRFPDVTVKFSMVEPKGGADHLFARLVPRLSDAAPKVRAAISRGQQRAGQGGPSFRHGGFPLCMMAGQEHLYDDLKTHRYWTMVEVGEDDFFPVDDANKLKPESSCAGCRHRGPCPGLYRAYATEYGEGEVSRVSGAAVSNAFDWVFEEMVTETFDPELGCPILRDGFRPYDRARHLFVRNDTKIGRYRADSRDFDDDQIRDIKHVRGQVYLDASRKPALDDFYRDLVKLQRSDVCEGCPHAEPCAGLFEPTWEDVFTRDDAVVLELLETLEGDVLDVGSGSGRYVELLRARARASKIRYRAVEPDPGARAALVGRWPDVDVVPTAVEGYEPDPSSLDHIMFLRSWNHLSDPDRVLRSMARSLRPGGSLLVVDNVAFGLARTVSQTKRARQAGTPFEHQRNDDAEAADRRIRAVGFELADRRDVGPETSNQWLLRYRMP